MTILVTVEMEPAGPEGPLVWWAKVPDIPGLRVAAPSLRELEFLAREAVREALAEQGITEPVELAMSLTDDSERTAGDGIATVMTPAKVGENEASTEGRRAIPGPALVA